MIQPLIFTALSKKFLTPVIVASIFAIVVDPTIFAAAVVTVITAITGSVVIIINAIGNMRKELMEAQTALLEKTSKIAAHVDGMATASSEKRLSDENMIIELRQQISKLEQTANLLAQSKIVGVIHNGPSSS